VLLSTVDQLAERILYPWQSTETLPGSLARIALYQARVPANERRPGRERSLFLAGDRNDTPSHLGIVACKRNGHVDGDLVDLKTVASIGADWGGALVRPRKEDSHAYPLPRGAGDTCGPGFVGVFRLFLKNRPK
jgi:hypothetical protein